MLFKVSIFQIYHNKKMKKKLDQDDSDPLGVVSSDEGFVLPGVVDGDEF